MIKDLRNLFRLKKENEAIKDRVIRDIRNHFEHEEEHYYISVKQVTSWSNNYIEYESNGGRNKTLSIEEYLNRIRPHLKYIINDLKKFDTWKIQLTIEINFISSKDNDEERVMDSKSDNIEFIIYDTVDEVNEELFELFLNRCQIGWKTSMRGSDFILIVFTYCITNVIK